MSKIGKSTETESRLTSGYLEMGRWEMGEGVGLMAEAYRFPLELMKMS